MTRAGLVPQSGTTPGLSYLAHGRRADDAGFEWIVDPARENPSPDGLARPILAFHQTPRSSAGAAAAPPRTVGGLDLFDAVVVSTSSGPQGDARLVVRREQQALRRAGELIEVIRIGQASPPALRARPLRLLHALADHATVADVTSAANSLPTRASQAAAARPIAGLLMPGSPETASWRQTVLRVMSAFFRRGYQSTQDQPILVVLPIAQASLVAKLAICLDELLPPADKPRGLTFATQPIASLDGELFKLVDSAIVSAGETVSFARISPAPLVCDLRSPADESEPMVDGLAWLLDSTLAIIEAFAQWQLGRADLRLADLDGGFWSRAKVRINEVGTQATPAEEVARMFSADSWHSLDMQTFQSLWARLGDRAGMETRGRVVAQLAKEAASFPPLVAWLASAEVARSSAGAAVPALLGGLFASAGSAVASPFSLEGV